MAAVSSCGVSSLYHKQGCEIRVGYFRMESDSESFSYLVESVTFIFFFTLVNSAWIFRCAGIAVGAVVVKF